MSYFSDGNTVVPLKKIGKSDIKNGTKLTFYPSENIFSNIKFEFSILEEVRELGFQTLILKYYLKDNRETPARKKLYWRFIKFVCGCLG